MLGRVDYHAPSAGSSAGWGGLGWLWQWLLGFAALLLLGAAAIAPSAWWWSTRVADTLRRRFAGSLLAGLVSVLVVPLLSALLAATVIGIPLAIVVFACYVGVLLLSGVFVSLRIGAWVMQRGGRPGASRYARLAVGALLLSLLAALPWIGWLAWLLVPLLGMGALLLERRDAWRGDSAPAAA